MSPKAFLMGVIVGAALTAGAFLVFGDEIRDSVSNTTETIGEGVQQVGENIQDTAKKIE